MVGSGVRRLVLDISECTSTATAWSAVFFEHLQELRELEFVATGCKTLTDAAIEKFVECRVDQLLRLEIQLAGCESLSPAAIDMLRTQMRLAGALRSLVLGLDGFGKQHCVMRHIAHALEEHQELRELTLGFAGCDVAVAAEVEILAQAIRRLGRLKTFRVDLNGCHGVESKFLVHLILSCQQNQLHTLEFSLAGQPLLPGAVAVAFGTLIDDLTCLQRVRLDLSGAKGMDRAALNQLAESLWNSKEIQEVTLDLRGTEADVLISTPDELTAFLMPDSQN